MIVQPILLLLVMLPLSSAVVWHVQPNQPIRHFQCPLNTVCHPLSQILQQYSTMHYNVNFTLLFQSGVHYLHDNAMFSSENTVQLIGQAGRDIPIIRCLTASQRDCGLTFQNISSIVISNLNFEGCGSIGRSTLNYTRCQPATLHFVGCYDTSLHNITITPSVNSSGVVIVDCQGPFILTNYTIIMEHCNNDKHALTQYGILINFTVHFNSASNTHYQLTIVQYHDDVNDVDCHNYAIGIGHLQRYAKYVTITVQLLNISHVINPRVLYYYSNACWSSSKNQLVINNSVFNSNRELSSTMFDIKLEDCWFKKSYMLQESKITFSHCQVTGNMWSTATPLITITSMFSVFSKSQMFILNCNFSNNKNMLILKIKSEKDLTWLYSNSVTIRNTSITDIDVNKTSLSLISTQHTLLSTSGLKVRNIKNVHSIIRLNAFSVIQISSLNILEYNRPRYLVYLNAGSYICMVDNCDYRMLDNRLRSIFFLDGHKNEGHPCIIQLVSSKGRLRGEKFGYMRNYVTSNLFKITMKNNIERHSMFPERELFSTRNCEMVSGAAFDQYSYAALAETFVVENNTNKQIHDICNCDKKGNPDCKRDQLVATYPGKTVTTKFVLQNDTDNTPEITTLIVDERQSNCTILDRNEIYQHQPNNCSEFHYTFSSLDNSNCSLYLRETTLNVTDKFWIKLQPCPLGFSFNTNSMTCKCDHVLSQYSLPVTSCDINNMMISRQANGWISGEVMDAEQVSDYVYTYMASSSCPFDFCQQYSSWLLVNDSDVQCQYNRVGIACGHCPANLSAIFGTSKCQQCSNTYLLIIIPLAIAGVLLVLLMFTLNLTVVNGSIATFILYTNIVSINRTLLFPTYSSSSVPLYVIIAMANLDLGMELCFYHGMDDYAKMWLQLAFPFYLILIAASLIVASRYSGIVQRVTAHRGLPVLATLFLLSYTKILSTVCTVLFLYTEVVTLSRNAMGSIIEYRVEIVWSVSTDVVLFEGKHIILFVVNVLLLLILIPFNIILLFNRKLSRFKIIQRFKPILDPYQAPYKDKFYYWAGYQLILRMAYLSAAGLNKSNNLTVAMLITSIAMCIHGYLHPFKHKLLNLQELMILLNTLIIYVSTNFDYYEVVIRATVGVAMMYFIMMLLWHSVTHTCGTCIRSILPNKVIQWKEKLSSSQELDELSVEHNSWVTGTYEEYREPMVVVNS